MARWTSFVADTDRDPSRTLREDGNPAHRLRVEHDERTLLVHLSGEDGDGWTVMAVDRATRRVAVAQARRQIDAAREAHERLYGWAECGRRGPPAAARATVPGPDPAAAGARLPHAPRARMTASSSRPRSVSS